MPALPVVTTVAELEALRADESRWLPAVAELARALGLGDTELDDLGGGTLVVGVGDAHVLKIVPEAFLREFLGESAALPIVARALPVATPEIRAIRSLPGWKVLLLTRVPGIALGRVWSDVTQPARVEIMHALGSTLAALHALAVPTMGHLAVDWKAYVTRESRACVGRQAGWGVPAHLVEQIPSCLAKVNLAATNTIALLHADLHHGNVLLERAVDGWSVSGLIDFGDAQCGDPLFDLITPALLVARGDAELFGALLDGYGIARSERGPELRARLTAYALLHRFNDLTRYLPWSPTPPVSLDAFGAVMFPFE